MYLSSDNLIRIFFTNQALSLIMIMKLKIIPSEGIVLPVGWNLVTVLPKCEVFSSLRHKPDIISGIYILL